MAPTTCPYCHTIKAPNAIYCHICGRAYSRADSRADEPSFLVPPEPEVRLSISSGFRFGVGFMFAATLFGIVWTLISLVYFAFSFGAIWRGFVGG